MASINTQGSVVSNPNKGIGGILKNIIQPKSPTQGGGLLNKSFNQPAPAPTPVQPGLLHPTVTAPTQHPVQHSVTTAPDGTSTTTQKFAPPEKTNQPAPTTAETNVGDQTQNAQRVITASDVNSNPNYRALGQQAGLLTQAQQSASNRQYAGKNQSIGQSYADIQRPQSTGNLAGELGNFNNQSTNALGNINAQQSNILAGATLATGGAENVLGAGAPQAFSYDSNVINPLTGQPMGAGATGTQFGSGPGAGENVRSYKEAQARNNAIQLDTPFISNQFDTALNYANSAGITGNTPVLAGFQNKYGANFQTNPAVIGFNNAITSLNEKLTAQGEEPIDIQTATYDKINQSKETVKKDLERKQSSNQHFMDKFDNASGESGNNTWGDIFGQ